MALLCIQMASSLHPVLLLGHSFVRRLSEDLRSQFDKRADENFKLSNDAIVHLHGVGGLTGRRLVQSKLGVVSSLSPHAVVLEISTNDLSALRPEVVGSEIEKLVRLLLETYSFRVLGVCEVLPRVRAPFLTDEVELEQSCQGRRLVWSVKIRRVRLTRCVFRYGPRDGMTYSAVKPID